MESVPKRTFSSFQAACAAQPPHTVRCVVDSGPLGLVTVPAHPASSHGLVVQQVLPGPAQRAGVKNRMHITSIDSCMCDQVESAQLQKLLESRPIQISFTDVPIPSALSTQHPPHIQLDQWCYAANASGYLGVLQLAGGAGYQMEFWKDGKLEHQQLFDQAEAAASAYAARYA